MSILVYNFFFFLLIKFTTFIFPTNVHLTHIQLFECFRHFDCVDTRLISAYQTLSLIGYTYDNQQIFKTASVQFRKTNLIKSTRHLNIYRFPKMVCAFLYKNCFINSYLLF